MVFNPFSGFARVMTEVCLGIAKQGFSKIFITSSHGGNMVWTDMAARMIFDQTDAQYARGVLFQAALVCQDLF